MKPNSILVTWWRFFMVPVIATVLVLMLTLNSNDRATVHSCRSHCHVIYTPTTQGDNTP